MAGHGELTGEEREGEGEGRGEGARLWGGRREAGAPWGAARGAWSAPAWLFLYVVREEEEIEQREEKENEKRERKKKRTKLRKFSVTPCVSNPYDYVNHIFKRP
jgi:hypothetical protein